MVIVLISARYKKLLEWINLHENKEIHSIDLIKKIGPRLFLYVETTLNFDAVCQVFQKTINEHGGLAYVYQFYSLYNGMIDYHAYLSNETKNAMKYYLNNQKDLYPEELKEYLRNRL